MAVILPQQNRSAGTYQGTLSQAEVTIPAGATSILAQMLMSQASIEDTANTVSFTVEGDWGNGWEPIAGPLDWQGGTGVVMPGQVRHAPGFGYSTSARPMPNDMRAIVVTNARWVWGVDITVT